MSNQPPNNGPWQQQPPQQPFPSNQPYPQQPQQQPNTGYPSNSQWPQQQPSQPFSPQQFPHEGYGQQPSEPQWPQQPAIYPQQQPMQPGGYSPPQYQPPPMMPPRSPRKKLSRRAWIIIGVIVLILVIASAVNANKSTNTPTVAAPTATPIIVNSQVTDTPISATATATPKPTPTAKPTPSFASFEDGTYQVGKDIQPGTYRTRSASSGCYYERLKGFSGSVGDILANDNTDDPAIVTILASDKGFDARDCGTWTKDLSQITTSKTTFPDGMYFVRTDITPGTYKNDGSTGCYYARLSNFTGGIDGIIANNNVDTPTIVTISSSDKGFQSKGCGTWTKI